jgi:hypothetical protein
MQRIDIFSDGCQLQQTGSGGGAVVIVRSASGQQENRSSIGCKSSRL